MLAQLKSISETGIEINTKFNFDLYYNNTLEYIRFEKSKLIYSYYVIGKEAVKFSVLKKFLQLCETLFCVLSFCKTYCQSKPIYGYLRTLI